MLHLLKAQGNIKNTNIKQVDKTIILYYIDFKQQNTKRLFMAKDTENIMEDNNLYIITSISPDTTNNMIIKLSQWVNALPLAKKTEEPTLVKNEEEPITDDTVYIIGQGNHSKILSPYEKFPDSQPVLNIYINSPGGNFEQTYPILSLIDMASARGAIIKTYNLYSAASCASAIAVYGTNGYRYMAERAHNIVHFGNRSMSYHQEGEMVNKTKFITQETFFFKEPYLLRTKITKKELKKYFDHEGSGLLDSTQCLEKGLCDWVITNDGRFVNNAKDLQSKQR